MFKTIYGRDLRKDNVFAFATPYMQKRYKDVAYIATGHYGGSGFFAVNAEEYLIFYKEFSRPPPHDFWSAKPCKTIYVEGTTKLFLIDTNFRE